MGTSSTLPAETEIFFTFQAHRTRLKSSAGFSYLRDRFPTSPKRSKEASASQRMRGLQVYKAICLQTAFIAVPPQTLPLTMTWALPQV